MNANTVGKKLIDKINRKCWENPSFKRDFILDPEAVIEKTFGVKFSHPDGKTLKIDDQSQKEIVYINIPKKVKIEDFELTDDQLQYVSGGDMGAIAAVLCIAYAAWDVGKGIGSGFNSSLV